MSGITSFTSLEAAERAAKAEAEHELRGAINNHAENLEHLNRHHAQMDVDVRHLQDQMDAVLDSLTQINRRLEQLDLERGPTQ